MAVSLSTISAIAARLGNKVLEEQVNFRSGLLKTGAIKPEKCEGQARVINVQAGGLSSVATLAGGGPLPIAASREAAQLLALPVSMIGHVSIPFDAAELVSGKNDSVDLVKNQFELVGRNLGMQLGRKLYDSKLSAFTADVIITSGTAASAFTVSDISGFRVGMSVELYVVSSLASRCRGTIASMTRSGDGGGTITFETGSLVVVSTGVVASITAAFATDAFYLPGSQSATQKFVGLADAGAATGDIYGTTVSNSDWFGNVSTPGAVLQLEHLRELADDVANRCGEDPDVVAMSRLVFQDYENLHISGRRYMEGEKMDAFGKNALAPTFRGAMVVVDDLCPSKEVYMFRSQDVALGEWRKFAPMVNGGNQAEISQTVYSYLIKVSGMHQLIVKRRNSIGKLTTVIDND